MGKIVSDNGLPLELYSNICISTEKIFLVGSTDRHREMLRRCCLEENNLPLEQKELGNNLNSPEMTREACRPELKAMCNTIKKKGTYQFSDFTLDVVKYEDTLNNNWKWATGWGYWYYTHNTVEHYGHAINRIMHLLHIMFDESVPDAKYVVSAHSPKLQGQTLVELYDTLFGEKKLSQIFKQDFENFPDHVVCFERMFEIDNTQLERVFFSDKSARMWRSFLHNEFHVDNYNRECPKPRVTVLQRTEGKGLRSILNYDIVEKVFKELGINSYENVSVSGESNLQQQMGLFSNFSLMISSHSSQLKNLIYAPKNSAILETRGTPPGYMIPSPFALGMSELGVIFDESVGHISDYSSCPEDHGCRKKKKYKTDYWLDEDMFRKSLKAVLDQQKQRCGQDYYDNL